ncbi:hypothetical protein FRC09_016364 [Ceratobasidium sp. 395]|nr:hypothetical protein FRC09_016364 [Ceratobasidium sp. 395]
MPPPKRETRVKKAYKVKCLTFGLLLTWLVVNPGSLFQVAHFLHHIFKYTVFVTLDYAIRIAMGADSVGLPIYLFIEYGATIAVFWYISFCIV